MSVVHHQRLPGPSQVSIERLFEEVRRHLPMDIRVARSPNRSQGLIPRIGNMLAAHRSSGRVNHIVGDVHYLAMALPSRGLVLTIHDCATLGRLGGIAREVFRQLWFVQPMKRARVVTTISETIRRELRDHVGELADRVRVIPNCVRSEFVPFARPFNVAAPVVLQVGTGWNKNVERVAEALRGTDCRLDIIGKLSEAQRGIIQRTGISFRELGRVSDLQVLEAFRQCDLVVFASLYEGFGLPILEAQATGRPVVTSNFGAMAEAAGNGAILVDPVEPKQIYDAVEAIRRDPQIRERLIIDGFHNLERFRADVVSAAYGRIYQDCLP